VIEQDEVLGFLLCRQIAPGEFELLNMAIDPEARRQGLARQLLQSALKRFPGVWYLETRESNAAAQKLYESVGFRICGRRAAYYTNPRETAIVMKQNGDCHEE
jgi:ribosomal-protein-alanine N-acetyltransferase